MSSKELDKPALEAEFARILVMVSNAGREELAEDLYEWWVEEFGESEKLRAILDYAFGEEE